ncbi:hypothetical protein [uncultured Bifidobacterium sp.]|uniref:hypothetical protein n=1 Tax=uncultured Bifidobacterium sp. TaxID=165187 RepID=UPI00258FC95A|nr:hypothetical protein [uncultured Bifidobacterium sp.]
MLSQSTQAEEIISLNKKEINKLRGITEAGKIRQRLGGILMDAVGLIDDAISLGDEVALEIGVGILTGKTRDTYFTLTRKDKEKNK